YDIHLSYRITPVNVYGLKSKLIEVIINLLDNAIKYGDHHSTIHVSVTKADNCMTFEVSNQCRDFNENILPNMFEPYYRGSKSTRDEKGSMGIGLYICKQIIEEHRGTISVQTNNDIVIFRVNLPIWQ
ncbi:MAG TPA: ATP-binding protein, partial [Pseudoneobacillus sp.]|nr:ATP-binding protein [Pseudoneobacillus sp.]